jgi:hypothetical protein
LYYLYRKQGRIKLPDSCHEQSGKTGARVFCQIRPSLEKQWVKADDEYITDREMKGLQRGNKDSIYLVNTDEGAQEGPQLEVVLVVE